MTTRAATRNRNSRTLHDPQKAPTAKPLLQMASRFSRARGLNKPSKTCSQLTIHLWRCGTLGLSLTRYSDHLAVHEDSSLPSPTGPSLINIRPLTTPCLHDYTRRCLLYPQDSVVSHVDDCFGGDRRAYLGASSGCHGQGIRSCHQAQA